MMQDGGSILVEQRPATATSVEPAQALIEEARRRHRRRRDGMAIILAVVLVIGLLLTWLAGGFGGNATRSLRSPSGNASTPSAPPPNVSVLPATPVALGHGPTDIYFLNGEQGWLATGCDGYCYESNPHIIRTVNGDTPGAT